MCKSISEVASGSFELVRIAIMEALSLEMLEQATKQIKSSRHLQDLQNTVKKARFDGNIIL